jgi:hypothetical protein
MEVSVKLNVPVYLLPREEPPPPQELAGWALEQVWTR